MRHAKKELTRDNVVLKIMEELRIQGKTEKSLEKAIGLGNGAFTRWKYQNVKSYVKYIDQIADYLNVTPAYLMNSSDNIVERENMTSSELKLIQMFRKMSGTEQECLLKSAELFLAATELRKIKGNKDMYSKKYNRNEEETTKTSGESLKEYENPLS